MNLFHVSIDLRESFGNVFYSSFHLNFKITQSPQIFLRVSFKISKANSARQSDLTLYCVHTKNTPGVQIRSTPGKPLHKKLTLSLLQGCLLILLEKTDKSGVLWGSIETIPYFSVSLGTSYP